jgi:hypothetical protein
MEYKFNEGRTKLSLRDQRKVALLLKEAKDKYQQDKKAYQKEWVQQPGCSITVGKYVDKHSQKGYLVPMVKTIFTDLRNKPNNDPVLSKASKRCYRWLTNLESGKYEEDGNCSSRKVRVVGGGRPVHAPEVSAELFDYFLDVRVQVQGRLSRSMMLTKALSIYQDYCEIKKGLGQVPDTLTPNDRWLSDWRKSHRISFKHPNKRYSINQNDRKRRIIHFLQNVWRTRYFFKSKYKKEPLFVSADQMPLHRNESSSSKTYAMKGRNETTYVRENDKLSRERVTVMTAVASSTAIQQPGIEFVFKGKGKYVKVSPPPGCSVQWAEKGSYRLEHLLKYISRLPRQNATMFPQNRVIFTLDDYSVHLHPSVEKAFFERGYFLILIGGGITGDVQVNDTSYHQEVKKLYRKNEQDTMLAKLRETDGIPAPDRDEMMKWFDLAWKGCNENVDMEAAFLSNMMLLPFDGSLDHLASRRLWELVGEEMVKFRTELLASTAPSNFQQLRKQIIPPEGVRRKQIQQDVPPDEGFELLDGEEICDGNEDKEEEVEVAVGEEAAAIGEEAAVPSEEATDPSEAVAGPSSKENEEPITEETTAAGDKASASGADDLQLLGEFAKVVNEFTERTRSELLFPMFSKIKSIVAATRTKSLKRKRADLKGNEGNEGNKMKKVVVDDNATEDSNVTEDDRDAWEVFE